MIIGLLLAINCGVCWGIFLAPVRVLKTWKWENIWLVWSFFATIAGPWAVAWWSVPNLLQVDHEVGIRMLLLTTFLGGVSGTAGFLYSYSVPFIGLGLATSLNAGASMAMSLLPLGVLHRNTIFHRSGFFTLVGVVLAVVGTFFCGAGGRYREKQSATPDVKRDGNRSQAFWKYVTLTLASGAIGSGMNLALAFPNPIFTIAHKHGSGDFGATCAFLAPYLAGAFVGNVIYAGRLLKRNQTLPLFFTKGAGFCLLVTILMAGVFLLGEYSYAGAVAVLGSFGAVITWGLSVAAMILTSSLWDVTRGEWSGQAARQMAVGVAVLMVAVVTLGVAQYLFRTGV